MCEGARVLLFLLHNPDSIGVPALTTELIGGTVLFSRGEAYMNDYQSGDEPEFFPSPEHFGSAAEIVAYVASLLGSDPEQTEVALEAVRKPSKPLPEPGSPMLVMVAVVSSALAVGLALAYLRQPLGSS